MDKQQVREEVMTKLKRLSASKRSSYNQELVTLVTTSPEWQEAERIGITISRAPEVDTTELIKAAWREEKEVYVPHSGKDRRLSFYLYTPETQLEKSSFGLLEPLDRTHAISKEKIDLMVVPGLVYSKKGYRIGFGGGYYDRYLVGYPGKTMALLYPFQLDHRVDSLIEWFDVPIQKLFIAEDSIIMNENDLEGE